MKDIFDFSDLFSTKIECLESKIVPDNNFFFLITGLPEDLAPDQDLAIISMINFPYSSDIVDIQYIKTGLDLANSFISGAFIVGSIGAYSAVYAGYFRPFWEADSNFF